MQIKSVDVLTLKNWLDNNEAIIIDVREIEEYKYDRIKNAINIPLAQLVDNIDIIKSYSNQKIVMQCRVGVRSMTACNILDANGFKRDLYNLEGGINAWRNSGF
ncbi:MAG: rhodanese-like domain-containing protein [Rickettsiales bacterium]|nr:MAG: rhodanese-like domain-containing protein [Rickettsiales bacterium]